MIVKTNSIYLAHHGVKGMKWGVRKNDNSQDKSRSKYNEKERIEKRKRIVKRVAIGAAIVAGSGLAIYGGYKLYKSGIPQKTIAIGKRIVDNFDKNYKIQDVNKTARNTNIKTSTRLAKFKTANMSSKERARASELKRTFESIKLEQNTYAGLTSAINDLPVDDERRGMALFPFDYGEWQYLVVNSGFNDYNYISKIPIEDINIHESANTIHKPKRKAR